MKNGFRNPMGLALIAGLFLTTGSCLEAQRPEADQRPPGPRLERDRQDREGRVQRGDRQRPKPFLMAGDPRFQQMLRLALVEEDQLEEAIKDWPDSQKMTPSRRKFLERRVNSFREGVRSEALEKAEEMGLNIAPDRQNEFIRDYWTARMRIEKEVREIAERELQQRSDEVRKRIEEKWK